MCRTYRDGTVAERLKRRDDDRTKLGRSGSVVLLYESQPIETRVATVTKCMKCSRETYTDTHHVTYAPRLCAELCRECHAKITGLNKRIAFLQRRRLANWQRAFLWSWFLKTTELADVKRISKARGRELLREMFSV